ncbi:MAG: hypothetical protein CMJ64_10995 [Planctomycetaceae bacterium]|nr:hypothetical protein [Planctomycetaceae bacterium]
MRACISRSLGWLFVILLLATPTTAADEDEALLQGLRARRLFSLAETHCRNRLADQDLPISERTSLTVGLIRVYAEQALNTPADKREQAWLRARETAAAFLSDHADAANSILIRVQDALTLLARGELARMESEVNSNRSEALADARKVLREATALLYKIDRELVELVPRQARNPLRPGELSSTALASLQHNVRFHLARAYRNQALCYDAGSSDRTASLTEALEQLKQPLLQLTPDDPLAVDARLQQTICLRLLGDTTAADQYLRSFAEIELTPDQQLLVRSEAIRLRLASEQPQKALAIIGQGRRVATVVSPELDFAFLETYVSLWKTAADSQDTTEGNRWRDKAITTAKFIEQTHGNYWGRRGELLLVRIGQGSGDGSLEILRRTADDLYRKRRFADAIAAYEKAAQAASKGGDKQHAFEFAYKAALVQQTAKAYEAASERFRKVAFANESHPHAANAHLLAIVNARQASAVAGEWLPEYAELLREHLKEWPSSAKTIDTAAFWLGEFESARADWTMAVDAFRRVSPASPNYSTAIGSLGACWQQKLAVLASQQAVAAELQQANVFFESLIRDEQGGLPGEWSETQREAVLTLASIRLNYGGDKLSSTEQLLKSALSAAPSPTPTWRTAANALLIVAIARQPGRDGEAMEFARQLGTASTDQLLDLFAQIGKTVEAASNSAKPALADLQLEIGDLLEPKFSELSDNQQRSVRTQRAGAFANAGRLDEAVVTYAQLAQEFHDDGAIQEAYASVLLDADDGDRLKQALDQWRRVAAKSRPRSARWFKAKYSIALTQYKLGDKAGAAKLIRYLQAAEDLGQSGLEQEFQRLLERCKT